MVRAEREAARGMAGGGARGKRARRGAGDGLVTSLEQVTELNSILMASSCTDLLILTPLEARGVPLL